MHVNIVHLHVCISMILLSNSSAVVPIGEISKLVDSACYCNTKSEKQPGMENPKITTIDRITTYIVNFATCHFTTTHVVTVGLDYRKGISTDNVKLNSIDGLC